MFEVARHSKIICTVDPKTIYNRDVVRWNSQTLTVRAISIHIVFKGGIMDIKGVVHCKKEPYDVYIGRPGKWGNPFPITPDTSRNLSLRLYRNWIKEQPELLSSLKELDGKVLGCWCKPKHPCHGDILGQLLREV